MITRFDNGLLWNYAILNTVIEYWVYFVLLDLLGGATERHIWPSNIGELCKTAADAS